MIKEEWNPSKGVEKKKCLYCERMFKNKFDMKKHCWEKHVNAEYVERYLSWRWNPSCRFGYW